MRFFPLQALPLPLLAKTSWRREKCDVIDSFSLHRSPLHLTIKHEWEGERKLSCNFASIKRKRNFSRKNASLSWFLRRQLFDYDLDSEYLSSDEIAFFEPRRVCGVAQDFFDSSGWLRRTFAFHPNRKKQKLKEQRRRPWKLSHLEVLSRTMQGVGHVGRKTLSCPTTREWALQLVCDELLRVTQETWNKMLSSFMIFTFKAFYWCIRMSFRSCAACLTVDIVNLGLIAWYQVQWTATETQTEDDVEFASKPRTFFLLTEKSQDEFWCRELPCNPLGCPRRSR